MYCHDYDSNSFSDITQFSVLQEAWVAYVCYWSWSSSQFHGRNIMLSSCSPAQIYIYIYIIIYYYYTEELQVFKTDLWCKVLQYLWIQLGSLIWFFTVSWTIGLPCITYLFSTFPSQVFIIFTVYLSHIEYIFLIWCINWMCESFAQINSSMSFCTYTMMYYVCFLHLSIYISDIYLSINCYWLKQFSTCYYCLFQTSLQCPTDICSKMSWCNRYSVTYSLFLAIFIVSCNQH